jgi:antitoxin VapB
MIVRPTFRSIWLTRSRPCHEKDNLPDTKCTGGFTKSVLTRAWQSSIDCYPLARLRGDPNQIWNHRLDYAEHSDPSGRALLLVMLVFVERNFTEFPLPWYYCLVYTIGMTSAKVFKNGRSQAIRLPKEFRVKSNEVYLKRVPGGVIVLERDPWEICLEACQALPDDFMKEGRQQEPAQDRNWDNGE